MSVNKLLFAPEWKIIGTVSTPDSGYKVLYPKQGYTQWFVMDDQGTEKQISLGFYPKNGISVTTYATSSVFERELNIALGLGLTFSGNFQGSTISVINVTTDMLKSLGAATAGYVLTATGSNFNWVPFTAPGISGTTNRIPKFSSTTSIGDSIMREDSSRILIGATPSVVSATLNNVGNFYNTGKIYLKDSNNLYIESSSGILVVTDQNFRIQDELGYRYLSLSTDNTGLSGAYTFSVLSDTIIMGHTATGRYLDSSLNRITVGTGSTGLGVNLYSNTPTGTLRIQDGSEGAKKALVSDATGLGAWTQLNESYVTFTGTQNFLARYNGTAINGLTASAIYQGLTSGAIVIGYTNPSLYDSDSNKLLVKGSASFAFDTAFGEKFYLGNTYLFGGINNLALGFSALNGNDLGAYVQQNIAIGINSMGNASVGAGFILNNIAIGQESMFSITNASQYNIGIGFQTLVVLQGGEDNIAIGRSSGSLMALGNKNISLGARALFNNQVSDSNISIGYESLFSSTSGNNNISIGESSLSSANTSNDSVIIGYAALANADTSAQDIVIGSNTGLNIANSSDNIFVGSNLDTTDIDTTNNLILASNYTVPTGVSSSILFGDGTGNIRFFSTPNSTFIGSHTITSGMINTSKNIGIGTDALSGLITGEENTAVGANSLKLLQAGDYNSAFGVSTMPNMQNAYYNTAVGYNCIYTATASSYNVAMGAFCLYSIVSGGYNVAIGNQTLFYSQYSNETIAIGRQAFSNALYSNSNIVIGGYDGLSVLTASNNICIGNLIDFTDTTVTNNTVIGSNLTVAAGITNSIILANGTGQIKFGSITYSLDVFGTASIQGGVGIKTTPDTNYDLTVAGDTYVGGKFALSKSANKAVGTFSLSLGAATVLNTSITNNSLIFLTHQTQNAVNGILSITSKTASVGFSVNSSNGSDNNLVAYMIVEAI